jgi:hypothetical protein
VPYLEKEINMSIKLKSKAEFEKEKFEERAGMISIYVCKDCKKIVLYSFVASGITPLKITCVKCGGITIAEDKSVVQQPDRVWYRPDGIEELEALTEIAYQAGWNEGLYRSASPIDVKGAILHNYIKHYNGGGLFARTLAEWIKI